ncbi:thiol reductant ABC exporter subunit CydD [uncultured Paraglaciecola sp.]|uniref:thiol reductant ABC exporter subunit CydD n=1 Tax=uncultured Paraglaciecola sp. TaxID=1765024 RepID=UPI0030D7D973|tara:strand:- start:16469 stop:18229 length:1761 start_codon:yes stop_codon:yes gene_type:complete
MEHDDKERPAEQEFLTGRALLNHFANEKKTLLWWSVIVGTLATFFLAMQWISFAWLVEDVISEQHSLIHQPVWLILFICAALGRVVSTRLQTMFGQNASIAIRSNIRKKLLLLWRHQSPLSSHLHSPAAAATQWVEDIEAMDGYFSKYWPQQMLAFISPLIILCVVAWLNWLCAVLLLISAPLIPLFMILVGMGAEQLNQKYSLVRQRLAGHFLNRVANLTTIKLLDAEQAVFGEVEAASDSYRKIITKTLRVAFLSSTVLEFFTSVAIASLAIYIGFSLYGAINWGPASSITLFSGLLILILAPEFFQPLRNLSQYYHDKAAALGAANNLLNVFNDPLKQQSADVVSTVTNIDTKLKQCSDKQNITQFPHQQPLLNLHKLAIGYSADSVLAEDINLQVKGGQLLAITGESGAGKSTLLYTLADYLKPLKGSVVTFPGKQMPIAYLPQRPWFKNASVLSNLEEFAPNATQEKMRETLTDLGLKEIFGKNHNGLNTMIGEHGQGFSGGQLQRLALARVMLNPTAIILLDEPTAKLDLISKEYIYAALKKLKKNAIVIVATHDLALLDIADLHVDLNQKEGLEGAVLV